MRAPITPAIANPGTQMLQWPDGVLGAWRLATPTAVGPNGQFRRTQGCQRSGAVVSHRCQRLIADRLEADAAPRWRGRANPTVAVPDGTAGGRASLATQLTARFSKPARTVWLATRTQVGDATPSPRPPGTPTDQRLATRICAARPNQPGWAWPPTWRRCPGWSSMTDGRAVLSSQWDRPQPPPPRRQPACCSVGCRPRARACSTATCA